MLGSSNSCNARGFASHDALDRPIKPCGEKTVYAANTLARALHGRGASRRRRTHTHARLCIRFGPARSSTVRGSQRTEAERGRELARTAHCPPQRSPFAINYSRWQSRGSSCKTRDGAPPEQASRRGTLALAPAGARAHRSRGPALFQAIAPASAGAVRPRRAGRGVGSGVRQRIGDRRQRRTTARADRRAAGGAAGAPRGPRDARTAAGPHRVAAADDGDRAESQRPDRRAPPDRPGPDGPCAPASARSTRSCPTHDTRWPASSSSPTPGSRPLRSSNATEWTSRPTRRS